MLKRLSQLKKTKPVTAAKPVKATTTKETYVAPQMQGTPNAALQAQLQAQADKTIELGLKNAQVVANIKTEVAKKAPVKKLRQLKKLRRLRKLRQLRKALNLPQKNNPGQIKLHLPLEKNLNTHHLRGK